VCSLAIVMDDASLYNVATDRVKYLFMLFELVLRPSALGASEAATCLRFLCEERQLLPRHRAQGLAVNQAHLDPSANLQRGVPQIL
jgi:hypothetical protein